jgi:hypothetical protein
MTGLLLIGEVEAAAIRAAIARARKKPIPWTVLRDCLPDNQESDTQFVDKDAEPQFQVMDDEKTRHCLAHRLCGLCGEQMGRHIFSRRPRNSVPV